MNICMSNCRSIELRKNASGSYKVRLTIDRGSKYCGARKSLGLGTRQEECALRRAFLMRCLLFRMGWFPGGRIAVKRLSGDEGERTFWDGVDQPFHEGVVKMGDRRGRTDREETMVVWYQVNGDEDIRCHRLRISGWKTDEQRGDLKILTQGLQHCATEQRQNPCRILCIKIAPDSDAAELPDCSMEPVQE